MKYASSKLQEHALVLASIYIIVVACAAKNYINRYSVSPSPCTLYPVAHYAKIQILKVSLLVFFNKLDLTAKFLIFANKTNKADVVSKKRVGLSVGKYPYDTSLGCTTLTALRTLLKRVLNSVKCA